MSTKWPMEATSPLPEFRRRQVDINKALVIVWTNEEGEEVDREEFDQELEKLDSLESNNISSNGLSNSGNSQPVESIPIPSVLQVDSEKNSEKPFTRPESYIIYYEPPYDFEATEYQLDDDDDDFLNLWNSSVKNGQSLRLRSLQLARIINLIENEMFLNRNKQDQELELATSDESDSIEIDEEILNAIEEIERPANEALLKFQKSLPRTDLKCNVCSSQASSPGNPIRICQHCNETAHFHCYLDPGSQNQSSHPVDLNWSCDRCEFIQRDQDSPSEQPHECHLCGNENGLMWRISDSDLFVHVLCALWNPEISADGRTLSATQSISSERWDSCCKICKHRGITVPCVARHCRVSFHPFCGHQSGFYMNLATGTCFCRKHSDEKKAQENHGNSSVPTQTIEEIERLIPFVKDQVRKALEPELPEALFEAVFCYWLTKRKKRNSSLIPRLNSLMEEEKETEKSGKRKKTRNNPETWSRLIRIRQNLEMVRMLLDMVKKREALKREWLEHTRNISEISFKTHKPCKVNFLKPSSSKQTRPSVSPKRSRPVTKSPKSPKGRSSPRRESTCPVNGLLGKRKPLPSLLDEPPKCKKRLFVGVKKLR